MPIDASLLNELTAGGAGAGLLAILKPAWKFWCAIRSGIIAEADLQNRDREAYERRIEQRENEAWERAEADISRLSTDLRQERADRVRLEAECHRALELARMWEGQAHNMRHGLAYVVGHFNAFLHKATELTEGRLDMGCFRDILARIDRIPSTPILPRFEDVQHSGVVPEDLPGGFVQRRVT